MCHIKKFVANTPLLYLSSHPPVNGKNCTMATVSTNYTAADELEPTAKKQKTDDILDFGGAGQKYRKLNLQQKLAVFEHVHALETMGMSINMALKPTCMSRPVYFNMKNNIGTIEKVVVNHPSLLYHCISINEILRISEADNLANQLKQEVINEEKMILVVEQEEARLSFARNSELISKVLKEELDVPTNSILVDLTN